MHNTRICYLNIFEIIKFKKYKIKNFSWEKKEEIMSSLLRHNFEDTKGTNSDLKDSRVSIIWILNFYCSQISCRRMPKVIQRPGNSWWRWWTFCWISSSPRMIETRKCSISIIHPTWCVSWTSKFPILVWLFNNFSSIVRPPWSTKLKQVSFTFIFKDFIN